MKREWIASLDALSDFQRLQRLCALEVFGLEYPEVHQLPSREAVQAWQRGDCETARTVGRTLN